MMALRYWPVCWKAYLSLCISEHRAVYVQCKCQPSTTTGQTHCGCTGDFTRLLVSDICCLTPSAPVDIVYLCLDSFIYFSELCATFTAAQLVSLCLFVIHLQWLTVNLILFITFFDYPHHLCEIYLFAASLPFILPWCSPITHPFSKNTCFLLSFISSFFTNALSYKTNKYLWDYLCLILRWMLAYKSAILELWVLPCTWTYWCWPIFLALAQLKIFKAYLFYNKSPLSSVTVSKGHLTLLKIPTFGLLF